MQKQLGQKTRQVPRFESDNGQSLLTAAVKGIGIIIISIVGYWIFDERLSLAKTLAMLSIIIGITLMKRGTDEGPSSDAPAAGRA